ncbi:MAG: hypothetical protein WBQ20_06050 [Methyloceanibacter sp.]
MTGLAIANPLILLLDYSKSGLGHDGGELIVGHVDGSLELGGVGGAEGSWASITTVQDSL